MGLGIASTVPNYVFTVYSMNRHHCSGGLGAKSRKTQGHNQAGEEHISKSKQNPVLGRLGKQADAWEM